MRRREETSASRARTAARCGRLPPTLPLQSRRLGDWSKVATEMMVDSRMLTLDARRSVLSGPANQAEGPRVVAAGSSSARAQRRARSAVLGRGRGRRRSAPRAKAARSEPLTVTVACQHEDIHALSGGHDLVFDAPTARLEPGWAPQARPRVGEQLPGGLLGDRR